MPVAACPPVDFPISNRHGERLDTAFHPGSPGSRRLVVIGHGVTGHKDRPFLVALAEGLAAAGIPALRLSWSGNGASEGAFSESNITKEVDDLGSVLDAAERAGWVLAYAGHSMGGAVGVRRAARDARIRLLISLAGIVRTREFAESAFGHLTPGKGLMFDKPGLILSQTYMDDLRHIDAVADDAARVTVPWLLVHGTNDDLVPIHHSYDALARAGDNARLVELSGANHVFEPGATPAMVDTVVTWCREQFVRLQIE